MLSCKEVTEQASNYIDADSGDSTNLPYWQIRVHLMLCRHCRRFVKHLRTSSQVAAHIAQGSEPIDADKILHKIKVPPKKP